MADTLFNKQRCRVIVVVAFVLYLFIFFTLLRRVIKKGSTIDTDETQFDLLFLKSLPEKTEYKTSVDFMRKSNSKMNNNEGTEMVINLVSFASVSPTTPPTFPPPLPPPSTTAISPPPPPPPSVSQRQIQEQQLTAILEALIGAGDFVGWANLLSSADLSSLPLSATFFIPGNDAMSNHQTLDLDPLLIAYHIIPQRLTFSDLLQFKPNTRIPTLLPSKFIVVTNNSLSNFTIDGSLITYPDLYVNPAFIVHGVDKILEYTVNGTDKSPPMNNTVPIAAPPLKPKSALPSFFPEGVRGSVNGSDSNSALSIEKLMIISVIWGVVSIFLLY